MTPRQSNLFFGRSVGLATAVGSLLIATTRSSAVILYKSATPNSSAPTGALANAGWQYAGTFGGFMGTPVSSQFFLTAQHIGGTSTFDYNGTTYHIDQTYNVSGAGNGPGYVSEPGTDLRLWKVTETFPTFAPLYNAAVDGAEVGKKMLVIGRGALRGDPVYAETSVDGPNTGRAGELKGWLWNAGTGQQTWGTNVVSAIVDGGSTLGSILAFDFDANGSSDEGTLAAGDSGGPVFIQSASGAWKLGGINYGVDGPWRFTSPSSTDPGSAGDSAFNASLFDAGGMYILADNNGNYQYIPDSTTDIPGSSYASDVSANLGWINQYISGANASTTPEPASIFGLLAGGVVLAGRRRRSLHHR